MKEWQIKIMIDTLMGNIKLDRDDKVSRAFIRAMIRQVFEAERERMATKMIGFIQGIKS